LLLAAVTAGCAHFPTGEPSNGGITEVRRQRAEQVVGDFEAKRSFAEFEAALARWDQEDVEGCRRRLEALLARDPQHHDAHVLMAQVHLFEHRYQQAWALIEKAVATDPNDAEAQFTAALVLDYTEQNHAALAYYERAAKLQPQNPVYAFFYQTARRERLGPSRPSSLPGVATASPSPGPASLPGGAHDTVSAQPAVELHTAPAVDLSVRQSAPAEEPPAGASALAVLAENLTTTPVDPTTTRVDPEPKRLQPSPSGVQLAAYCEPAEDDDDTPAADDADRADTGNDRPNVASDRVEGEAIPSNGDEADVPEELQSAVSAAVSAVQANRPDLAVALLEEAKDSFGNSARAYRVLGLAHYRLGDYKSSEVALRQALSLDNCGALSYFLMGCTLAKLGQTESAETHFRQAGRIDPKYAQRR